MKIELQELLRDYEETELPLTPRRSVDPEAVRRRVREKLDDKPRRRFPARKALLALAACLVLAGSAFAYAQYRASQVKTVTAEDIETYGLLHAFESNTLYSVTPEAEGAAEAEAPHILGVRPGYLPDEVCEKESSTLRSKLAYWEQEYDLSLLDSTPLSEEELESAYTRICTGPAGQNGGSWWTVTVDIYSAEDLQDKAVIVNGVNTSQEEGTFLDMEATWLTQDFDGHTTYNLILFHPAYQCVIHLGGVSADGHIDFSVLEEIAAGLEIVDTGLPAGDYTDSDWTLFSVARG